jgi:hypothetical protein
MSLVGETKPKLKWTLTRGSEPRCIQALRGMKERATPGEYAPPDRVNHHVPNLQPLRERTGSQQPAWNTSAVGDQGALMPDPYGLGMALISGCPVLPVEPCWCGSRSKHAFVQGEYAELVRTLYVAHREVVAGNLQSDGRI